MNPYHRAASLVGLSAALGLALASCGKDPAVVFLGKLAQAESTPAYAAFCDEPLVCTSATPNTCARTFTHIGNACLRRADDAPAQTSQATMRTTLGKAENAFRMSLPMSQGGDRLKTATGLAEALELRRGFSSGPEVAQINAALGEVAGELRTLPEGGAERAGYYEAGISQNLAERVATPSAAQCPDLQAALSKLPVATDPGVFGERVAQRRRQIETAMTKRSCPDAS